MLLKWCLFNRKTSFNGQCCLLINFSDVYFSLTVRFRTVGPQTPFIEYAPVLRKKLKKYQFIRAVSSWQFDETYVKVNGKWFYLYSAIDKYEETLDMYFSPKRNRHAVYAFLKRVLGYVP